MFKKCVQLWIVQVFHCYTQKVCYFLPYIGSLQKIMFPPGEKKYPRAGKGPPSGQKNNRRVSFNRVKSNFKIFKKKCDGDSKCNGDSNLLSRPIENIPHTKIILDMEILLIHSGIKIDHQKFQFKKILRETWKLVTSMFSFM